MTDLSAGQIEGPTDRWAMGDFITDLLARLDDTPGARRDREANRPRRAEHAQPVHLARIAIPQRPLSYAVSRRTDPATSREAAASVIDPSKGTYAKILAAFKTLDRYGVGFTDEQLFDVWQNQHRRLGRDWPPISPSGLRSRRNELTRRGLIVDSGERAKTRAGRRSIVWRLP